jgi:hypothetical protein
VQDAVASRAFDMSSLLSYSVSTTLQRDRVWLAFSDIENWPQFSTLYSNLRWVGFPWLSGSSILGKIAPHELTVRYVVEQCDPGRHVSYIGHSTEAGFASHRDIQLVDSESEGTTIQVSYYLAGCGHVLDSGQNFVKTLLECWFRKLPDIATNWRRLPTQPRS